MFLFEIIGTLQRIIFKCVLIILYASVLMLGGKGGSMVPYFVEAGHKSGHCGLGSR
jgi:hypothetical protein